MNNEVSFILVYALIGLAVSIGIVTLVLVNRIDDRIGELINKKVEHGKWITLWQACDPDTSTHCECSVCGRYSERPVGTYCKWCGSFLGKDDSDGQ